MVHKAEINFKLKVTKKTLIDSKDIKKFQNYDVIFLHIPNLKNNEDYSIMTKQKFQKSDIFQLCNIIYKISINLKHDAKLLIMGESIILPYIHTYLKNTLRYQMWIAVRHSENFKKKNELINEHLGILLYSKQDKMEHSLIRVRYEYCNSCEKTIKDYGGKKHLYHSYGTSLSDVWKDFVISKQDEFPKLIIDRIRDLFSIKPNTNMIAGSLKNYKKIKIIKKHIPDLLFVKLPTIKQRNRILIKSNKIICGDSITELQKIKNNTIDMIFTDPPYNLAKNYDSFTDNMNMNDYFNWCDNWLFELSRILKKGGSLFVLNIPVSTMRHFVFLHQILNFQNWIVWDALSTPLKKIMPAHYSILYFTKGNHPKYLNTSSKNNQISIMPLNYGFCARPQCIKKRQLVGADDKKPLTDLWSDIHRIKHNSLRENHPTLLPPKLLQRLITMASNEQDIILDCFNGVGTTTLIAEQCKRRYVGIEKSNEYVSTSKKRHLDLKNGIDPFPKRKSIPIAKNSTLRRVPVRKYKIPKRTLQLEVKDISKKIKKMPQRNDVIKFSKYPIKYFDDYFRNWFEVTEAARTTGMSENKIN